MITTPSGNCTIPVIDLSPLISGDPKGEKYVAQCIGEACRTIGFFYVTGHDVDSALMHRVFECSTEFFQQPLAVKQEVGFVENRGYVSIGGEALDPTQPGDFKEAFQMGLEEDLDESDAASIRSCCNPWPNIPNFRSILMEFYDQMRTLGLILHRAFSLDLGVDPEYFAQQFHKPLATLRLLHYPPSHTPLAPGQMSAGVHTDYGNVTILKTDTVGGLWVQSRSGTWIEAPVIPDTFICNIGDCLMRWTNDIYVSTPHKVMSPPHCHRYSIAFFFDPDPDAVVTCLPSCCSIDRPARYPPIRAADFIQSKLDPTYNLPTVTPVSPPVQTQTG
jgi:isopenicillin N synthase-like dioxygenase